MNLRWAALIFGLIWSAPALADEPVSDMICELHVWGGGYPTRVAKSNALVKVKVDPAETDLSNPLSNASLYSPINRARAWSDAELLKLMPSTGKVSIIRHSELLDFDKIKLKSVKSRLSASTAPCYADLVIANIYGIFPNPDFQGLLVDAIDGGNRLVMDLWMQRFDAANTKPTKFRKKNDAPLLSFRVDRPSFAESMADASEKILVAFGEAAAKNQNRK